MMMVFADKKLYSPIKLIVSLLTLQVFLFYTFSYKLTLIKYLSSRMQTANRSAGKDNGSELIMSVFYVFW